MPPKRWYSASPAPRARHTSPSYPPPSQKPVFGWLLHNKSIINWRPSKATMYFYFFYFLPLHSTPQTMEQRPPHVPPRSRLLSNAPLTIDDNFRLVIVSPIKRRPSKAKGPPIYLFFLSINSTPQTTGSRPPHTFRPSIASSPTHPLTSSPSPI
jgi:hypothetical protein